MCSEFKGRGERHKLRAGQALALLRRSLDTWTAGELRRLVVKLAPRGGVFG